MLRSKQKMDSSKFYGRNATPDASSTSKVATAREFGSCDATYSVAVFNCKEPLLRSIDSSGKSSHNSMRINSCGVAYGNGINNSAVISVSAAGSVTSSVNNVGKCNNIANGNGSYMNVMSVPIGPLQYHQKKITTDEYQSRLYHNTADYICRDDFYSKNNVSGGGENNSHINATSLTVQTQGQIQHQHNHQTKQPPHHHYHQLSQQAPQHYYHHYNQQQLSKTVEGIQHDTIDPLDDIICSSSSLGSGRVMVAMQTQTSKCDQLAAPTALTIASLQSPTPPIMYTVHRVVTTAQIQTAGGNTFTSSSSISSVVSAVRNEVDNLENISTPSSTACFVQGDISSYSESIFVDGKANSSNIVAGKSLFHNSAGVRPSRSTPETYPYTIESLRIQQKTDNTINRKEDKDNISANYVIAIN